MCQASPPTLPGSLDIHTCAEESAQLQRSPALVALAEQSELCKLRRISSRDTWGWLSGASAKSSWAPRLVLLAPAHTANCIDGLEESVEP